MVSNLGKSAAGCWYVLGWSGDCWPARLPMARGANMDSWRLCPAGTGVQKAECWGQMVMVEAETGSAVG